MKTVRVPKKPDPLHADIQRLLIGRRSIAVERDMQQAIAVLRRHQDEIGYRTERTEAQTEMLAGLEWL